MLWVGDDIPVDSEHLFSIEIKSCLLHSGEIMITALQKTRAVSWIRLGNFYFAGSIQLLRFYVMRDRVGVFLHIKCFKRQLYVLRCPCIIEIVNEYR